MLGSNNTKERKIKGVMFSRLLVVLAIPIIPTIIFLIFSGGVNNTIFDFNLIKSETLKAFILKITPWIFSISWVFILGLFASRISNSLDAIDRSFQVVPRRLNLFYGVNAVIILMVFVFPLLTPLICILAFASLGYRVTIAIVGWEDDDKAPKSALIVAMICAIFPGIISLTVMPDMFTFAQSIWVSWQNYLDIFYVFSMTLCTALTIGSLAILMKTGVSEFEQLKNIGGQEPPDVRWIVGLEGILFMLFVFMAWKEIEILKMFYYAGFGISIIVPIINYFKGKKLTSDFKSYSAGYVLSAILLGANVLGMESLGLGEIVKITSIIISAATYIILFFIIFLFADLDD